MQCWNEAVRDLPREEVGGGLGGPWFWLDRTEYNKGSVNTKQPVRLERELLLGR